jgi:uncharacterized protein (TIGR02246 family)
MSGNPSDELAVRKLISVYVDSLLRRDHEAHANTWAKDGEWRFFGNVFKGREAIIAFWRKATETTPLIWHIPHALILDVGQTEGTGRLYMNEVATMPNGKTNVVMGISHDRYIKEDGEWRFAKRHFDLVYGGPSDFSGRFFQIAQYGPPPHDDNPDRPATPSLQEYVGGQ